MSFSLALLAGLAVVALIAGLSPAFRRLLTDKLVETSPEQVSSPSKRLMAASVLSSLAVILFAISVPILIVLALLDFTTELNVHPLWYETLVTLPLGLWGLSYFLSLRRARR